MGLTKIKTEVGRRNPQEVDFLVDSGASYTVLPEKVWKSLGLKPFEKMEFVLARFYDNKRNFGGMAQI